jgi:flavin-binding protein dodecin
MSTAKVIEVVGQSNEGFEDAVREAVKSVSRKIQNIRCVDVVKWTADVENGQLVRFRADCKILYVEE